MLFLALAFGILLDHLLGEVRRYHPLVAFGNLANTLEDFFNRRLSGLSFPGLSFLARLTFSRKPGAIILGGLAWAIAVLPLTGFLVWLYIQFSALQFWLDVALVYFAIGHRSLREHILAIFQPLQQHDINKAREALAFIVSRDVTNLDGDGVRKAAIESALENGADATFSALFWFLLLGAPGILFYRLCNTLDAMWGYKTPRFLYFGRCAARVDDALNWLPARLVALSYLLLGHSKSAWRCWRRQAKYCASPNAGPVMAAGAGALRVSLGGPAIYHGQAIDKPNLGEGPIPQNHDVMRSVALLDKTLILWLSVVFVLVTSTGLYRWVSHGL